MRVDHKLANRQSLDVADLVDVEIVLQAPPSPYRDAQLQAFARQAVPIRSRMEVLTQRGAAAAAMSCGMVAIIDQELAEELAYKDPTVHLATFAAVPPWEVAVVHRKDRPLSLVGEAMLHRLKLASTDYLYDREAG